MVVELAGVRALIGCTAADLDELARASRVEDLDTAAVLAGVPALGAISIGS